MSSPVASLFAGSPSLSLTISRNQSGITGHHKPCSSGGSSGDSPHGTNNALPSSSGVSSGERETEREIAEERKTSSAVSHRVESFSSIVRDDRQSDMQICGLSQQRRQTDVITGEPSSGSATQSPGERPTIAPKPPNLYGDAIVRYASLTLSLHRSAGLSIAALKFTIGEDYGIRRNRWPEPPPLEISPPKPQPERKTSDERKRGDKTQPV